MHQLPQGGVLTAQGVELAAADAGLLSPEHGAEGRMPGYRCPDHVEGFGPFFGVGFRLVFIAAQVRDWDAEYVRDFLQDRHAVDGADSPLNL